MTNSIGTSASSMASKASSVFGSAREAFKAMADAAISTDAIAERQATETARKGRRGTVLDCYA